MLLAEQPVHQRFVRPGPLVLGSTLLKSPTPTADRDRTVSRRSEPRSRTALMGEQPNPWDLLQPQDATIRHRGATRRCGICLMAQTISSPFSRFERGRRVIGVIDLPFRRQRADLIALKRERISRYRVKTLRSDFPRYCPRFSPRTATEFTDISRNFPWCFHHVTADVEVPNLPGENWTLGGDKPVIPRVAFIR